LNRDIECRYGLVGNDEVRLEDQGSGDPDPLTLAAREFVGIASGMPGVEPDQLEHALDPISSFVAIVDAVEPQTFGDGITDLCPWVE
jgi:hypothetical protein